jgi:hypothetical protein
MSRHEGVRQMRRIKLVIEVLCIISVSMLGTTGLALDEAILTPTSAEIVPAEEQ